MFNGLQGLSKHIVPGSVIMPLGKIATARITTECGRPKTFSAVFVTAFKRIVHGVSGPAVALALAFGPTAALAESSPVDSLAAGFQAPPESARPRVWWHWISGNVDPEGITLDMEWMKRIGIAGLQMFDGDMGAPQIVDHRVIALSPEWLRDLKFAASEADRLHLELSMAAAPGWSETGGPWVRPEMAMKKYVWSVTQIEGGHRPASALAQPPSITGPFQDMALKPDHFGHPYKGAAAYHDIAVLAYRVPGDDVPLAALKPTITASTGEDTAKLVDGHLESTVSLAAPDGRSTVTFAFAAPQTMHALTYAGPLPGRYNDGPGGAIEASDDGTNWRRIGSLPGAAQRPAPERTIAFSATRARQFRVVLTVPPGTPLDVAELAFVPGARVNAFEDKAGFGVLAEVDTLATPDVGTSAIAPGSVIDLTGKMRADGTLDWQAPHGGRWEVLRLGYSLLGTTNHPATPEVTGLEADKMDAAAVRAHLDGYLAPVMRELGPLVGAKGLRFLTTDSWEAGIQNWTGSMIADFKRLRGYDPVPWFPVLAGRVVESSESSDRFLWDYRRTIADLIAANHYGTITAFARENGLGYYGEAVGVSWPTIADGMQAKSYTDIPMGEFWAIPFGEKPAAYNGLPSNEFPADIMETASTAHVYGRPLVAAESLTSSLAQYTATPWNLKWVVDKYLAMGVNRIVLHTSPHQPGADHKPGLSLGPFSQVFTRNETWADMAKPWIDYLSRSSYLLQQGHPVADVLYFYGEGAPSGVPYRERQSPAVPLGYTADYINASALLSEVSVRDGRLVTKGGASYAVLVLPNTLTTMSAPLIEKLRDLVRAGATISGPRPMGSPTRSSSDEDVRAIGADLWGYLDGRVSTKATFGAGRIWWGAPLSQVLESTGVLPDFRYSDAKFGSDVVFAHRRLDDGDIYFVANQTGEQREIEAQFRTTGREAEIWRADDGSVQPASFRLGPDATTVPLLLAPYEAQFVVFRHHTGIPERHIPAVMSEQIAALPTHWTVNFEAGRGAPRQASFPALTDFTTNTDPGIRYFSGVATYREKFDAPAPAKGARIFIDLGAVHEVARVRLNGREVGIAWKPPYRVEVTDAIKTGRNLIEVEVANLWRNRLIGDAQPGTAHKYAWTSEPPGGSFGKIGDPVTPRSPLLPSGLLGPVRLVAER